MNVMNEQSIEGLVIDLCESLGYSYCYGPSVVRDGFEQVVLKDILCELTPSIQMVKQVSIIL